jgi:serine/threonine protein kinase
MENNLYHVKIVDFGQIKAKLASNETDTFLPQGSPAYTPPEVLDECNCHHCNIDVWSMAVIFYELLYN